MVKLSNAGSKVATPFTLGLIHKCIISSFILRIYLRPPLKITQLRPWMQVQKMVSTGQLVSINTLTMKLRSASVEHWFFRQEGKNCQMQVKKCQKQVKWKALIRLLLNIIFLDRKRSDSRDSRYFYFSYFLLLLLWASYFMSFVFN